MLSNSPDKQQLYRILSLDHHIQATVPDYFFSVQYDIKCVLKWIMSNYATICDVAVKYDLY